MRRVRGAWSIVAVCAATLLGACGRGGGPCRALVRARDHAAVLRRCPGTEEATLARAFRDSGAADNATVDGVAGLVMPLLGGPYTDDAAYLIGYVELSSRDPRRVERGKRYLALAMVLYRLGHRYASAADVARQLAFGADIDEGLALALGAVADAKLSGEPRALSAAYTALGNTYGQIGMAEDARDAFVRAEVAGETSPRLGDTYLKHGMLLIDLPSVTEVRAGIEYLDEALRISGDPEGPVGIAARLNLAAAYIDQDQIAKGLEVIAGLERNPDSGTVGRSTLVRAYALARQGQTDAAERALAQAAIDRDDLEAEDEPYFMRFAIEAGRGAAARGDLDVAADYYRQAVEVAETSRGRTGRVELRPWVLARNAEVYRELIDLLARIGTPASTAEALEYAEALHARTWLDVVVGTEADDRGALPAARLRARAPSQPRLSAAALLERLAGREALVYVAGWRLHAHAGRVDVAPLSPATIAAAAAFQADPSDRAVAAAAAAALLPPDVATRDEPLYVVPDSQLGDVPFAALVIDGKRLIERRAVARLPGLAVLGCRPGPTPWTTKVVAVGDAAGDLPAARAEVIRVARRDARVGAAADRASVLDASAAALLHIAVHGHVSRAGGVLELADAPLSAAEIYEHRVAPRVAVLTGCDTGAADLATEDWGSFPSAFLAAGSAFVVATTRAVPDVEAAAVVDAYYRTDATLDPVTRLARAQRALAVGGRLLRIIGLPDPVRPAVWGAFAVWGDAACGP